MPSESESMQELLESLNREIKGDDQYHTFPDRNGYAINLAGALRDSIAEKARELIEGKSEKDENWKKVRTAYSDSDTSSSAYVYLNVEDISDSGNIRTIFKLRVSDHETPFKDAEESVRYEHAVQTAHFDGFKNVDDDGFPIMLGVDMDDSRWGKYDNKQYAYDEDGKQRWFRISKVDFEKLANEGFGILKKVINGLDLAKTLDDIGKESDSDLSESDMMLLKRWKYILP